MANDSSGDREADQAPSPPTAPAPEPVPPEPYSTEEIGKSLDPPGEERDG